MDLTVTVTDELPTNWLLIKAPEDGQVEIRVSPKVEEWALAALRPEVAADVVNAVERGPQ